MVLGVRGAWTTFNPRVADAEGEGRVHALEQLYAVWVDWLQTWDRFTVEAEELIEVDDARVFVLYRRRAKVRGTD